MTLELQSQSQIFGFSVGAVRSSVTGDSVGNSSSPVRLFYRREDVHSWDNRRLSDESLVALRRLQAAQERLDEATRELLECTMVGIKDSEDLDAIIRLRQDMQGRGISWSPCVQVLEDSPLSSIEESHLAEIAITVGIRFKGREVAATSTEPIDKEEEEEAAEEDAVESI